MRLRVSAVSAFVASSRHAWPSSRKYSTPPVRVRVKRGRTRPTPWLSGPRAAPPRTGGGGGGAGPAPAPPGRPPPPGGPPPPPRAPPPPGPPTTPPPPPPPPPPPLLKNGGVAPAPNATTPAGNACPASAPPYW